MFIEVKGLPVKDRFWMFQYLADPEAQGKSRRLHEKPDYIVTLGDVANLWPGHVVDEIVTLYKGIGIIDPMRQKLIEPAAICFKGANNDGAYDFSRVNWDKVIDYFRWESAAIDNDTPEKEKAMGLMIEALEAKYGYFPFSHKAVYSPYDL